MRLILLCCERRGIKDMRSLVSKRAVVTGILLGGVTASTLVVSANRGEDPRTKTPLGSVVSSKKYREVWAVSGYGDGVPVELEVAAQFPQKVAIVVGEIVSVYPTSFTELPQGQRFHWTPVDVRVEKSSFGRVKKDDVLALSVEGGVVGDTEYRSSNQSTPVSGLVTGMRVMAVVERAANQGGKGEYSIAQVYPVRNNVVLYPGEYMLTEEDALAKGRRGREKFDKDLREGKKTPEIVAEMDDPESDKVAKRV